MKISLALVLAATAAFGRGGVPPPPVPFAELRDVPYDTPAALAAKGAYARSICRLDLRYPTAATNFATVVSIHGGGLVAGSRCYSPWPRERFALDPVAHVAVGYRLLTNATPSECVGDAASAVAWVLRNIAAYGGDPKKVFLTGVSGGGYLTAMIGMNPVFLAAHGLKPTDLAGIAPLTGQMTKHFNIRTVGFADGDAQFLPKIDAWAPLHFATRSPLPPCCFLTGGRDVEWKARVEENALLAASLRALGHGNISFFETEGDHGGGVTPSAAFLRDFVMRTVDAGGVGRFAPNERIAFFGDSITHDGRFVADLQLFAALRHPGWNVRCLNVGLSGDTASGALDRWSWDLLPLRPNRVFAMFGMNDIDREAWKNASPTVEHQKRRTAALQRYGRNCAELVALMGKAPGVKRVLVTPSPYDQYSDAPAANNALCNDPGLAGCAEQIRALAARHTLGLVDFHAPITALLRAHPKRLLCGGDRVHPQDEGHLLMAALVLETMGEGPLVSRVVIDARKGRAEKLADGLSRKCSVSALTVSTNAVRFTYAPKALPFPALPEYLSVDAFHPLTDRLNREELVVRGLAKGTYALAFDGVEVGSFSAEALEKGVNIALLPTPNQMRAREAAKIARDLRALEARRRHIVSNTRRLRAAHVDLRNTAAIEKCLEPWIVEMERQRQPWIAPQRQAFDTCRALGWDLSSLAAEAEDLSERLNAVRPATSRVSLTLR